jgi:hypothetical protein
MGQLLFDKQDDWAEGFVSSAQSDVIPDNASPRMLNACLDSIGLGTAVVTKRRGMTVMNATPTTGSGAVIGNFAFFRRGGAALTQHHILISDTGRIDTLSTGGALTAVSTALTAGAHYPDYAEANNLAFIVNGEDAVKTNGTTAWTFGLTAPATAPTLAAGAAGNHNGDYEARVTFIHTRGTETAESSAGPTSSVVTIANTQIDWTAIPVSADAQVTGRRLYLRNTATQTNFYFITEIANNTATTYTSNLLDTALTVIGPDPA